MFLKSLWTGKKKAAQQLSYIQVKNQGEITGNLISNVLKIPRFKLIKINVILLTILNIYLFRSLK